tara:strand:+ start:315 stop:524 length:210 start_codon:yes stop_codon:yes gene_type:complete
VELDQQIQSLDHQSLEQEVALDMDKLVVVIQQELVELVVAETLVQMERIILVVAAVVMALMVVMVDQEW